MTKADGNSVITEYTYDYQGTRSSKSVNAAETRYVTYTMSGLSYVLCETDLWGNITAEYVRGAQLHTMTKDDATYVYLSDAHLNVRAMADADGTLINRYRYDAWGRTLYEEETIENPYRYCQEEYDAESGNTYLRARYYSAESANFLSADVYAGSIDNPMSLNKYAYAGANPVMYADPSGYMFSMAECLTATNMQNILREASNIAMRTAIGGLIGGAIGGVIGAGDALSAGGDWDDVIHSFHQGFLSGAAVGMFFGAFGKVFMAWKYYKVAMTALALGGFGVGMFNAGVSWGEGEYWQAMYRAGVSILSITVWYKMYGADGEEVLQNLLKRLQTGNGKGGSVTINVNGKTVVTDNSTFDPYFIDKQGRTNIQRMEQGLAPIGTDGKSVNLHHIDQTNSGPVMEITATEHQQNYSILHSNLGQSPSQINRAEFNIWRKGYWEWRSENLN